MAESKVTSKLIVAYDENVQKVMQTKVKPEPWLHFVMYTVTSVEFTGMNAKRSVSKYAEYIIYVWDTREVLDSGSVDLDDVKYLTERLKQVGIRRVRDNYATLKGGRATAMANDLLFTKQAYYIL